LRHEDGRRHQLVHRSCPHDPVFFEQRLIGRIIAGDGTGMADGEPRCFSGSAHLDGDDGNVPGIGLFQSSGEALGIAHGLQE
jgi:hypothetical protein